MVVHCGPSHYTQKSLCHHHLHKLLVVDLTINICLTDHLVDLLVSQLLAQVGHDMAQFCCADETIAITIKDLECLNELLLGVSVLHLSRHKRQELGEINGSVSISIHLIDHVLQLSFGGILSQRAHHSSQLLGCDGAIAIFVEQGESLLELSDLLLSKLVGHVERGGEVRGKPFVKRM